MKIKFILPLALTAACFAAAAADAPKSEPEITESYTLSELTALAPTHINAPDVPYVLRFVRPTALHESVISAPGQLIVSYSGLNNRLQVMLTLYTDPQFNRAIQDYSAFKELAVGQFADKVHLTAGQYQIISEDRTPEAYSIELEGYLRKAADNLLPDMHNELYQKVITKDQVSARLICQAQGTQAMRAETEAVYKQISGMCRAIAQSLTIERAPQPQD